MEQIKWQNKNLFKNINLRFQRYILGEFPWNERLTGITGAKGIGKTWVMVQHMKQKYTSPEEALYISLDDLRFTHDHFPDITDDFVNRGGIHIFIDEIHKDPEWNTELKTICNRHPALKITFAGSSLLQTRDLEKNSENQFLVFNLPGISFREYLNFTLKTELEPISLEEIMEYHTPLAMDISKKIKPLKYFEEYLKYGYFPYFLSNKTLNYRKLPEDVNFAIEMDLPQLRSVDPAKTRNIKQLLYIVAQSAPFKPNISQLARIIGVTRNTLNEYFKYLEDARLLNMLNKNASGINLLQKPDRIYIENPNLAYALNDQQPDIENLRKIFFLNQLRVKHLVTYPDEGDFLIDQKYLFETGGKNKSPEQISGNKNSFIAADDIEFGYENKIPLWLFGFLY